MTKKMVRVFNTDLTKEQSEIFDQIATKRKELKISPIGLDMDLETQVRTSNRLGKTPKEREQLLTNLLRDWFNKL